ncbi:hypothetical protein WDZ92_38950, partial [Nostoc sp. NIES-2111]
VTTDPNLPVNFGVSEIIVGHRLVAPTTFTSPGPQPQPLEIEASIEDPSLATIALSDSGTPAPSQRFNVGSSFGLWVHGLASSGATTLRLRITGRPDLRIPIKLYPSTVAFTADAISLAANATLPSLSLASYALDPTTLLPLLQQPLIPGQRIELSITSLSPELSLERPQCAFTAANFSPLDTQFCATSLSWTKPGSYTLELTPPSGFTIPRARHSLRVLINPARPNFFLPEAVGDALYRTQINTIPQNQVRLRYTLISLNPELLLFSSSAEAPPQARLEGLVGDPVFVHGLASEGIARVRLEGSGFVASEYLVPLVSARLTFRDPFGNTAPDPLLLNVGAETRVFLHLSSPGGLSLAGTRPGAPEIRFRVQSSQPAILSATGDSAFGVGISQRPIDLRGLAPGNASLTVELSSAPVAPLRITVRQPSLQSARFLIAKDTRISVTLRLEDSSPAPTTP